MLELSKEELNNIIGVLETAREELQAQDAPKEILQTDLMAAAAALKVKQRMCQAKVEARAIADNWKDFNAKYIYEQIEKWRLVRKEARAKHDDTSIAISICYINAFQQILNKHNATRNPQEYAA